MGLDSHLPIKPSLIIDTGVVPADIATAYGVDYISGVILMGGYPYKSMFKEIENSPAQEVVPDYLSIDLNIWYQAVKVCFLNIRLGFSSSFFF